MSNFTLGSSFVETFCLVGSVDVSVQEAGGIEGWVQHDTTVYAAASGFAYNRYGYAAPTIWSDILSDENGIPMGNEVTLTEITLRMFHLGGGTYPASPVGGNSINENCCYGSIFIDWINDKVSGTINMVADNNMAYNQLAHFDGNLDADITATFTAGLSLVGTATIHASTGASGIKRLITKLPHPHSDNAARGRMQFYKPMWYFRNFNWSS